jgi:hypothetical protein
MANMKKSDPALAKQVKKDVKFLKEKAAAKPMSKPVTKAPAKPVPLPTQPAKSKARITPMPKTTKKAPGKMTPQDAAMKKILEKKYGKIYG